MHRNSGHWSKTIAAKSNKQYFFLLIQPTHFAPQEIWSVWSVSNVACFSVLANCFGKTAHLDRITNKKNCSSSIKTTTSLIFICFDFFFYYDTLKLVLFFSFFFFCFTRHICLWPLFDISYRHFFCLPFP